MTEPAPSSETDNPWTVVNVVFHHLVAEGTRRPGRVATRASRPPNPAESGRGRSTHHGRTIMFANREGHRRVPRLDLKPLS